MYKRNDRGMIYTNNILKLAIHVILRKVDM